MISLLPRLSLLMGVGWAREIGEDQSRFAGIEGPTAYVDGALETEAAASMDEPVSLEGKVAWGGYAEHYFLSAFIPSESAGYRFVAVAGAGVAEAQLWNEDANGSVSYQLFVGPKSINLLSSLGHDLEEAVDLGIFWFIARPMLELLFFLHRFLGNYGWAIVLLTVGVRLAFYPINQRQAAAMKAMQRIQPELKKIQDKYKDDRERMSKEVMEVYRRHKVNPLSGCLPMLVQLPVFFGLYNALMQAIELRHAPFFGWITDLSQPDRLGTLAIPFVEPAHGLEPDEGEVRYSDRSQQPGQEDPEHDESEPVVLPIGHDPSGGEEERHDRERDRGGQG